MPHSSPMSNQPIANHTHSNHYSDDERILEAKFGLCDGVVITIHARLSVRSDASCLGARTRTQTHPNTTPSCLRHKVRNSRESIHTRQNPKLAFGYYVVFFFLSSTSTLSGAIHLCGRVCVCVLFCVVRDWFRVCRYVEEFYGNRATASKMIRVRSCQVMNADV